MKNIAFAPGAYSDYLDWLKTDKKVFLKITDLIRELLKPHRKEEVSPRLLSTNIVAFGHVE